MKLTFLSRAICAAVLLSSAPLAAQATDMMVHDAYLRSSTAQSTSGAAFMMVMNHSAVDDRLIGASSDVADKVELHTHMEDANGVMRMSAIEGGVPIAANEEHVFQRGGDHLMFMGLKRPLEQGETIKVTLEFEKAGEVDIDVVVDQDRKPMEGQMKMDHSGHDTMQHGDHSKMSN